MIELRPSYVEEMDALRRRLAEAEQTIVALASAEIDAIAHETVSTPILLHRAQEELLRREQLFTAVFNGVEDGILLVDSEDVFVDANPAACALLGNGKSALIGRRMVDVAVAEHTAPAERAGIRGGGQRRGLIRVLLPDGAARELEYNATRHILPGLHLLVIRDVTALNRARVERERAESALRASEERYRLLFESSPLPIWLTDVLSARFIAVNRAALQLFGYSREEFLALGLPDLLPEEASEVHQALQDSEANAARVATRRPLTKSGVRVEVAAMSQSFVLDERPVALVIAQDMTERNRLEAQLAQSRKMEAIGILAGGVAHDFNNLLSVMVTYTSFALQALEPGALRADIEQVAKASERAVALTRQLLAFSRQQLLEPVIMDLNATVVGIEPMLRRLLGEHVEVSLVTEPALGRVSADPGQIEQVIMNLVVNARDAMPFGGELTIGTANVMVAEGAAARFPGSKSGRHVRLSVTDTGSGIDATTRERMFEPFFTTKEVGKGTGLGLSTVLGIVEQSGGYLDVKSELGKGTTFEIYLPRVDGIAKPQSAPPPSKAPAGGNETILVVEDDEQVRTLTSSVLRRYGYDVLVASNGGEAFLISEQHPSPIHLLLTDVVMPRMNGRQLAERLAPARPEMKVLFMTGYTGDSVVRQGLFDADIALLQKPITPEALARRVRSLLDGAAGG